MSKIWKNCRRRLWMVPKSTSDKEKLVCTSSKTKIFTQIKNVRNSDQKGIMELGKFFKLFLSETLRH